MKIGIALIISTISLATCSILQCASFNSFDFIDRSGLTSPYLQIPVYERAQQTTCESEEYEECNQTICNSNEDE